MESIDTEASTYLTTSFRFGNAIADLASRMLVKLGESQPVKGNPNLLSRIGTTNPSAVLARTNASTISDPAFLPAAGLVRGFRGVS